jgi:hypothetical protein
MLLKNLFWFFSIKPVACMREEMQRCREKLPRKMVRGGGEEERRREGGEMRRDKQRSLTYQA